LNAPETRAVEKKQTIPEQNRRNQVFLPSAATSQEVKAWKTPSAFSDAGGVFHFRLDAFRNAAKLANGCNDYLLFLALEPPDLAIEQPDLDIAAVQKLASGIERVGVRVGLDRFVRSYPIVSID
jgi:hypothetical protein